MKASHVFRTLALLGTAAVLGCGGLTDPENPPGEPGELVAAGLSRTSIELTWATPASGSVDEFEIERATSTGDFAPAASVGGGTLTYIDEGLDPDTRYRYRVRACNDGGCSDFTAVATARTFGTLTIATGSLPDGAVGQPYTQAIVAAEAGDDYAFSVVAGALPAGLVLDAISGIISGTPEQEEIAEFTVRVTSIDGQTAERAFTLEIVAALPVVIENVALPPVIVGGSYDVGLEASGGGASYTWSVVAGTLPAGLTLDPAGRIHGTPTTEGSSTLT
ncbi:MAG: hypothetical protein GWM90_27895, partial [Gemmatimonadetes bacterium]|nr:hypothetical protein [Gemmatimonadota bacterium]NIQ58840.1 hypothetical protein [Gemmatimonadota bacterium]NIU79008.1 hypothetical protein [Gammaproteobacteria bacterium]NIX47752.1 hypothetical protein [Gemmatimonadota bacterium]NIY12110.1 hypothetical protein [Gemmatimonadota bacterium]